jgi:hypothetical protein
MSDGDSDEAERGIPDWEDEYVDRVADRLMYSYDLERDRRVEGERFTLYGRIEVENRKQFLHPAISYGRHEKVGHLFCTRRDRVSATDLERLVDLGETLAGAWIDPDEQHYETEFVFALVAPVTDEVREFVSAFESRTLLKYGYYGHYYVRLLVVDPDSETLVASPGTDVAAAFRLWSSGREGSRGVLGRLGSLVSRRS